MFVYDRNKYIRALMNRLGFSRPIGLALESSRIVEYPWVMRSVPSNGKVLDVGSTGSQLPLMLLALGNEVWTIDVRKYEYENISERLHTVIGDIRKTDFSPSFFDTVLAVSTIEHIGLGRYGDSIDVEGDRNAIVEIGRIMAPNAVLLLTVPFGKRAITKNHRVYDATLLSALLKDFGLIQTEYFLRRGRFWIRSSLDDVENVDSSVSERAIACVRATKNSGER